LLVPFLLPRFACLPAYKHTEQKQNDQLGALAALYKKPLGFLFLKKYLQFTHFVRFQPIIQLAILQTTYKGST